MEATCSLDRISHLDAFGRIILPRGTYKTPLNTANYLRCSNGYCLPPSAFLSSSSINNFSSQASSTQHSSLTGIGNTFLCPLDLGSAEHRSPDLISALNNSSECLARAERGFVPSIHTCSGNRNVSSIRCKYMTSGARGVSAHWFHPLSPSRCARGNLRTIGNLDGESCSRATMGMMIVRLHAQLGSKSPNCKMTCLYLAHGFGTVDRLSAQQRTQLFYVFSAGGNGKRMPFGALRQLCEATGQSGTGQPVPEEENSESAPEQGPPAVPDLPVASPVDSESAEVDWRAFRARLVVTEHTPTNNESDSSIDKDKTGSVPISALGTRWAHPILAPEAGCVLIATDKIDGQQGFERSVILLLSPGSSKPREGPYGLILNRPLSCHIKDIKPKDRTLVKFFGNCQVHHGGPLDEDMFLLLHGTQGVKGYREVIPGVYYGAASGLEEIMKGKSRPLDYRFFFGYSGWSVEQLKKEIDAGLWCVAACSTDLITGHSAAGLWEEVLLLMGGKYAELSKRPRRRHL